MFSPREEGGPPNELRRQLHVQGLPTVVCQPCRGLVRFDLPILFPPRLVALPLALSPLLPAAAQQPDRRAPRRSEAAAAARRIAAVGLAIAAAARGRLLSLGPDHYGRLAVVASRPCARRRAPSVKAGDERHHVATRCSAAACRRAGCFAGLAQPSRPLAQIGQIPLEIRAGSLGASRIQCAWPYLSSYAYCYRVCSLCLSLHRAVHRWAARRALREVL
jgi:hypothetical protein